MEYRIKLDGGDILVVTLEVETAEDVAPEPMALGAALLDALGIGRPQAKPGLNPVQQPLKRQPPAEENADTWLRQTSERSLGQKFKRQARADGDTGD